MLCSCLAACASQTMVGQNQNNGAPNALPDAQTFGLVSNQAPNGLSMPVMINHMQSPTKTVNSLQAPSNQTYYYDQGNVALNNDDVAALKIQANYLATHPGATVRLEGFADSKGSRENNILLAWKRIQLIQQDLLQYGVAPGQIVMVSYGKEKPAVDGYGEPIWALNRRVSISVRG